MLKIWRGPEDALIGRFGALSGPEIVVCYRSLQPVPGAWSPSEGEEPVEDLSLRYSVAIPMDQVTELRALLRRAGNSFDQRVIYLEVAGYVEFLEVRSEDGFLKV